MALLLATAGDDSDAAAAVGWTGLTGNTPSAIVTGSTLLGSPWGAGATMTPMTGALPAPSPGATAGPSPLTPGGAWMHSPAIGTAMSPPYQ